MVSALAGPTGALKVGRSITPAGIAAMLPRR